MLDLGPKNSGGFFPARMGRKLIELLTNIEEKVFFY